MDTLKQTKSPTYLYLISSRYELEQLCAMEMKYIFKDKTKKDYHITKEDIDISRSIFVKQRITILYSDDTVEAIEKRMLDDDLHFEQYKIYYTKFQEVPYQERLQSMRKLGFAIEGEFAIKDPKVEFMLTKIDGIWIFGMIYNNPNTYLDRIKKPFNYSNALDVVLAKTVVNIASNNNNDLKMIDPCCGIGTVLIEGRVSGIDIKGYEKNPLIKQHCNSNLEYFGFTGDVTKTDMTKTTKHFDVAILDLPYGQFSLITQEEQIELIKKTKEISDKSVIITMEDMSEMITSIGFTIIDSCKIKKSNAFSRYVMVCI